MKCPTCRSPTKVVDTRQRERYQYRQRQCLGCYEKFGTVELPDDHFRVLVRRLNSMADYMKRVAKTLRRFDPLPPYIDPHWGYRSEENDEA